MASALASAACGGGPVTETGVTVVTPPTDTTTHTGTVQRATLNVQVTIDPNDRSLATAVGLGVAGLTVTAQRLASTDPLLTAQLSSTGEANSRISAESTRSS
ncbi:MAG: hypothetical protein ABJC26_08895, partial [Gemmatimonadaceae bacterium]